MDNIIRLQKIETKLLDKIEKDLDSASNVSLSAVEALEIIRFLIFNEESYKNTKQCSCKE